MTPPTPEPSPHPPHRWGFSRRIAAAYFVLVGLILLLYFEELIGEFGSGLWDKAKVWVAQNQFRAIEVASVLGGLLATLIGVVGLRIVRYFAGRREQRRAQLVDPQDLLKFDSDLSASRFQLVTTIAQIGAGTALLVGIYFTYQNLTATREGQVTDRFLRAVDQLGARDKDGNPAPEIRLGGVYGLRRVAQDSREDYPPIREILNDYIAINAPWPPTNSAKAATPTPAVGPLPALAPTPAAIPTPRADIQAALDFLGKPIAKFEQPAASAPVNLPGTDLRGAVLNKLNLENADLIGAHLDGANLDEAYLFGTHLSGAYLRGAYLIGAHLENADLDDADLEHAHLKNARLEYANLEQADLDGAYLAGAHLEGAHLDGAHLENADLEGAQLFGAHLENADFSTVGLTKEQIAFAHGNKNTKLPPDLEPYRPASWK